MPSKLLFFYDYDLLSYWVSEQNLIHVAMLYTTFLHPSKVPYVRFSPLNAPLIPLLYQVCIRVYSNYQVSIAYSQVLKTVKRGSHPLEVHTNLTK